MYEEEKVKHDQLSTMTLSFSQFDLTPLQTELQKKSSSRTQPVGQI